MKLVRFYILLVLVYFQPSIRGQVETDWATRNPTCSTENRTVDGLGTEYKVCYISHVYLTNPSQFQFNGYPYHSHNEIVLDNTVMHLLPMNFFAHLSSTEKLICANCELTLLNYNDFQSATNLKELDFRENRLTSLQTNTFYMAQSLKIINLSYNEINVVHTGAFNGLLKLTYLNLSNNKITMMDEELFKTCPDLVTVHLQANQLTDMPFHFHDLDVKLLTFNVSDNAIENVNIPFPVSVLDASNNRLSAFNISAPLQLTRLQLQSSSIKAVDFLSEMVNLEYLDLSHNALHVSHSQFKPLINLKYLYLENVTLPPVNYETFAHQVQLKALDISYNNLQAINFNSFSSLSELEQLFIDGNNLTIISELTNFELIFPKLKLIGLSNNLFTCDHVRKIMRQLKDQRVEIYVEANDFNSNKTYFGRMACIDNNVTSLADLSASGLPKHIPDHAHLIAHMESKHDAEMNGIWNILNKTQMEKLILQNDLEIMKNTSQELQKTVNTLQFQLSQKQNITDDKIIPQPLLPVISGMSSDAGNLNQRVNNLYAMMAMMSSRNQSAAQQPMTHSSPPPKESTVEAQHLNNQLAEEQNTVAADVATTRVLVTLILIAVLVFVMAKSIIFYFKRQTVRIPRVFRSNVTMAEVMEDNNM